MPTGPPGYRAKQRVAELELERAGGLALPLANEEKAGGDVGGDPVRQEFIGLPHGHSPLLQPARRLCEDVDNLARVAGRSLADECQHRCAGGTRPAAALSLMAAGRSYDLGSCKRDPFQPISITRRFIYRRSNPAKAARFPLGALRNQSPGFV